MAAPERERTEVLALFDLLDGLATQSAALSKEASKTQRKQVL
jgi:hypothetical protein